MSRSGGRPAGRREWTALAVLTLPTAVVSFDLGALLLALPQLDAELRAGSTQLLWITDVYGFFLAGCLLPMGTLADRIGRRRLLLLGASVFGTLSVAAAFAPSAAALIVLRALLGVAGATLMPCALGLLSAMFMDARQRGQAIAVWATALMSGAALGPVASGLLLERFWWGSVFLVAVPAIALLLLVGPRLLPEHRPVENGALDVVSVLLALGAVLPLVYALKLLAVDGLHAIGPAVVAAAIGCGSTMVFLHRQRRLATPLLDLLLFSEPAFRLANGIGLLAAAGMSGVFLLYSQYVMATPDMPALQAGLWLAPAAVATAIGSLLTSRLRRRRAPETVLGSGLAVAAAGCLLLAAVAPAGGLVLTAVAVAVVHLGLGPALIVITTLVVAGAPHRRAGSAAAISETAAELGTALGLALFGSLATAAHRAVVPLGATVAASAAAAPVDRQNPAGEVSGLPHLPVGLADGLPAARHVLAAGFTVAGTVMAVLFAGLAALAVRRLRGASLDDPPDPTGRNDHAHLALAVHPPRHRGDDAGDGLAFPRAPAAPGAAVLPRLPPHPPSSPRGRRCAGDLPDRPSTSPRVPHAQCLAGPAGSRLVGPERPAPRSHAPASSGDDRVDVHVLGGPRRTVAGVLGRGPVPARRGTHGTPNLLIGGLRATGEPVDVAAGAGRVDGRTLPARSLRSTGRREDDRPPGVRPPLGEDPPARPRARGRGPDAFGNPERPSMLLVMGLGFQLIHWPDDLCRQLAAEGFRVVRFDDRDAGRSTHLPGRRYTLEDMADDAVGLLDAVDVDSAHVVGASLGGMIVQTMAIRHPGRVRSLASLMSTTGRRGTGRTSLRILRHALGRRPRTEEEAIERRIRTFGAIGSTGFTRDLDELRRVSALAFRRDPDARGGRRRQHHAVRAAGDRTEALRQLRVPTVVVHGTEDLMCHPSGGRATAESIPGARLELIPGMGHDLPRGAWCQLVRALAGNASHSPPTTSFRVLTTVPTKR